jgi:site-specific DNA-methyltransferase (adenine-specific)
MKSLPDKFFQLACVDPPYGINAPNMQMGHAPNRKEKGQYSGTSTTQKLKGRLNTESGKLKNSILNTSVIDWDNQRPSPEYFKELFRVSVNQIIWGGNYFTDMLPVSRCWIVWNKNQPWDNFSQAELAWTSFDSPVKVFTFSNRGGANEEKKIHPTQKSIELYNYCLYHFAKPSDTIFDSHLGSQSSRISAYKSGLNFYGCEISENYFTEGNLRFEKHMAQKTIDFDTPIAEQKIINF